MSRQSYDFLIPLLYQALAEPIGLLLQVSDPELLRARLYAARKKTQDQDLQGLQIRSSPFEEGNLLIVNRKIELIR